MNKNFDDFLKSIDAAEILTKATESFCKDGVIETSAIPALAVSVSIKVLEAYHKWLFENCD